MAREKDQVTYKGRPIGITPDFSMKILKARKDLGKLRETTGQHRLLNPAKLSITIH